MLFPPSRSATAGPDQDSLKTPTDSNGPWMKPIFVQVKRLEPQPNLGLVFFGFFFWLFKAAGA